MHHPITKSGLCWVLVKLAGVYLVYTALTTVVSALIGWVSVREALEQLPPIRRSSASTPIWSIGFSSFLPLSLGIYMLTSGNSIYRCLMSIPLGSDGCFGGEKIHAAGLTELELVEFEAWIKDNPEVSDRDPIDQLALFRDSLARR
jgi:hypothetical protein